MRIAVVGAGSWGTAISVVIAQKGFNVKLWARNSETAQTINKSRYNPRYLTDILLPTNILATSDFAEAVEGCEIILLAVPSHAMRQIMKRLRPYLRNGNVLVSLAKGIEVGTLQRMSEVISDETPPHINRNIAVLSGPNHAEEIGRGLPTTTVISAFRESVAKKLQKTLMTSNFRVYINPDMVGVELAAATKNVIAIAAGMSDGLEFGDNAKASLMTRGLAEMARLGLKMGAEPLTFAGLAGMGDLIVTCTSRHSRNRWVGEQIARGKTVVEINREMKMVAEGIISSKAILDLARRIGVEMPIAQSVYSVLYTGKTPKDCVEDLMLRSATVEVEEVVLPEKNVWQIVD